MLKINDVHIIMCNFGSSCRIESAFEVIAGGIWSPFPLPARETKFK